MKSTLPHRLPIFLNIRIDHSMTKSTTTMATYEARSPRPGLNVPPGVALHHLEDIVANSLPGMTI